MPVVIADESTPTMSFVTCWDVRLFALGIIVAPTDALAGDAPTAPCHGLQICPFGSPLGKIKLVVPRTGRLDLGLDARRDIVSLGLRDARRTSLPKSHDVDVENINAPPFMRETASTQKFSKRPSLLSNPSTASLTVNSTRPVRSIAMTPYIPKVTDAATANKANNCARGAPTIVDAAQRDHSIR